MLFGSSTVSQGMSQPAEILTLTLPLRSRLVVVGGLFKEVTVHGGIKFVIDRIITAIALLRSAIPKKHTFDCPRFKLHPSSGWKMDIHNTPKYARRKRVRRGDMSKRIERGKRGLELEDFCGKAISKVGGSSNGLGPKVYRYMSFKH